MLPMAAVGSASCQQHTNKCTSEPTSKRSPQSAAAARGSHQFEFVSECRHRSLCNSVDDAADLQRARAAVVAVGAGERLPSSGLLPSRSALVPRVALVAAHCTDRVMHSGTRGGQSEAHSRDEQSRGAASTSSAALQRAPGRLGGETRGSRMWGAQCRNSPRLSGAVCVTRWPRTAAVHEQRFLHVAPGALLQLLAREKYDTSE